MLIVLWILAVNITITNVMGFYSLFKRLQMEKQRREQMQQKQTLPTQPKKDCPGCRRRAELAKPAVNVPHNPNGVPYPVEVPTVGEVLQETVDKTK